jgi:hypothetical protein
VVVEGIGLVVGLTEDCVVEDVGLMTHTPACFLLISKNFIYKDQVFAHLVLTPVTLYGTKQCVFVLVCHVISATYRIVLMCAGTSFHTFCVMWVRAGGAG